MSIKRNGKMRWNKDRKWLTQLSIPRGHMNWGTEKAMTFLLASGLMVIIIMVLAVFGIVVVNGLPYYWPKKIARLELKDGSEVIGELHGKKKALDSDLMRYKVKIGNRKLNGRDFVLIDVGDVKDISYPENYVLFERFEWGNAYGYPKDMTFKEMKKEFKRVKKLRVKCDRFEKRKLVNLFERIDHIEFKIEKKGKTRLQPKFDKLMAQYEKNETKFTQMITEAKETSLTIITAEEVESEFLYYNIVHTHAVNNQNWLQKLGLMTARMFEFIFADPRESNTEGGVMPAIFGTVMLVFLMSILVFPLGVITAIFLNEYAKKGPLVRIIRITIFNLAGVPSIVYGVFGLGFFVYGMGSFFDHTFFADYLPNPTFGSGGILWASLTLAVLTLPVVVVASLEGLKSVPQIYREGAFALSATKWEVIKDVVIPNAMPGMLTGLILAISRAAGEVAPLMLTGVVKSAPALPLDGKFPFLHLERKFMHLGFHIYDVGFQSPNVEAARPMVFNTTLLLLALVFILNLAAIIIRNNMRKKLSRSGV